MKWKSRFEGFLIRASRLDHEGHRYVPGITEFKPIDVEQTKVELDLVNEGRSRGQEERPPSSEDHFDAVEQSVITLMEREITLATDSYTSGLNTYAHRVKSLDMTGRYTEIEVGIKNTITEFRRCVHEGLDTLYNDRRHVAELESNLTDFKATNNLKRSAHYPTSHILHFGVLAIIVAIESIVNGFVFSTGSENGLVGGIVVACCVAGLNVAWGFLLGRFVIPSINHRQVIRKVFGALGILAFPALALAFNLAVAHYRDAMTGDQPDLAAQIALQTLKTAPFGIQDMMSWFLLMMGCLFSLIAAFEGYRWDDPYPGYGRLYRQVQAATEGYSQSKGDQLAELTEIKDETVKEVLDVQQSINLRRGEFLSLMTSRGRLKANYHAHLLHLESVANDLLRTYRDANQATRKTPKPLHFRDRWILPQPPEPSIDPFFGLDPASFDRQSELAAQTLGQRIDELNQAFLTAMESYERLDQLTLKDFRNGSSPQTTAIPA